MTGRTYTDHLMATFCLQDVRDLLGYLEDSMMTIPLLLSTLRMYVMYFVDCKTPC